MKAGGHVVFEEWGGGEELGEGERAGEHISLILSENFHSSPCCPGRLKPSLCFFLTRGPLAVLLLLAGLGEGEGRRSRQSYPGLAKGWSSARSGRSDLCYLRGPPATPGCDEQGPSIFRGRGHPPLLERGGGRGGKYRERRGRPVLPLSPQGLLATSRRCRLLPKRLDWHFRSFCAAWKPVTVANLPSPRLLSYPFSVSAC